MAYRALILDLDGTTIPHAIDSRPSERVIRAIHQARRHIFVSIATGRPLYIANPIIELLKLSGLCILANGVHVYDPISQKIVREIVLMRNIIDKITKIGTSHQITPFIYD